MAGLLILGSSVASAALMVSLAPSQTTLGAGGGLVTFTATITGTENELLLGYDIFIDITGVDLNAGPGPIVISNPTPIAFGAPFFSPLVPGGAGRDFGASNTGLFNSLDTTGGLDLFTFDATFAPNPGPEVIHNFNFTENVAGFGLESSLGPIDVNTVAFTGATVTVSAIPEPGGLAAIASLGAVAFGFRRRRES
ncbi:MAG: PEP-CTERM sorting domain-containing protein [Planctomycetota bacterium]